MADEHNEQGAGINLPEGWLERGIAGTRVLLLRGLALRAIGLLTSLALVALVAPADLGLFAVVRGAIGLIQFTSELGFELALIRRHDEPTRQQLAALSGQRTLVLLAILAAAAFVPGAATLFGSVPPAYAGLMLLTIGALLVTPVAGACRIVLERRLEFRQLSLVEVRVVLLQNVGLVLFALGGHFREGIFLVQAGSMVYATIALRTIQAVPPLSFDLRPLRPLWGEGVGFAGAALLGRLMESVTPIIIARLFGLDMAGFWHFAGRVGQFIQILLDAYSRAAVAVAGRLVHNVALLRSFAADVLRAAAALVYPAVGLLYAALPLVAGWFPQWAAAVPIAQVYVLALGVLGVIHAAFWPVAVARSGPRVALAQSTCSVLIAWLGLGVLRLVDGRQLALPFVAEQAAAVAFMIWVLPSAVRPSLGRLVWKPLLAVGYCVCLVAVSQRLGWPPALAALMGAAPCGVLLVHAALRTWVTPRIELSPAPDSR